MAIINVRRTRDVLVESGVVDEDKALELAVALDEELTEGAVPRAGVEAQLTVLQAKLDAHQARMESQMDAHQARTDAKLAEMDAENERRMNRLQLFILGTGAVVIGVIGVLIAVL